ncbi:iron-siderophore ABC transporter substrate-binding protein [Oceanicella sp. SM1341]|uniref:iron-siderophore ABC transporter substrate-binding protein n=1 Tax=Oceanicella sp. SM1341 TaxID=1548889 RepID=UPI000E47C8C5|nr:iron-siderophore ABC transporter substrate-binding protein [Oceanicella sp. SM1341]
MRIGHPIATLLLAFAAAAAAAAGLPAAAQACEGTLIEEAAVYDAPLCVPAAPARVVVLDASFGLGIALDVDLPVAGAPLELMSNEALAEEARARGVTSIGAVTEPSLERIVGLAPDLIIGFPGNEALAASIYPQVSQLAPTLLYTSADWRAFYGVLARLTGHEEEIAERFAAYDARLADIRARMPDTTVSVLRITSWDFQVYLDSPGAYAPFAVMRDAGVRRSAYETTEDPAEVLRRPDWEELAALDGEVLLYIIGGTNDSATNGRQEEVFSDPLWQLLPAVQAGRVHAIDPATWMEFSGLASANRVLDDLETYVIGGQ